MTRAAAAAAAAAATSSSAVAELIHGDGLAWNSLVGEADRAFRLGVQLDGNGQARRASAAFHEAATLYQCLLDSPSEFGHVTALTEEEVSAVLSYACQSLGSLNADALKNPMAAVRLYRLAAAMVPSADSYDGMGRCLEAATAGNGLREAVDCYRRAAQLDPENRHVQFHLAVALDRLSKQDPSLEQEARDLLEQLQRQEAVHSCLVDSWGYVRWHTRKCSDTDLNLYRGARDMFELAAEGAGPLLRRGGLACEFGVGSGRSLRMTREVLPLDRPIHGFDTFTGMPAARGEVPAGAYSTGGMVPVMEEGSQVFHRGLFRDTVRPFWEGQGDGAFLAYAHVDCRLYSSTLDALEGIHGRVLPGTVLVFGEYICRPSWRQDEFRAWRECCKRFGWKYEYLAFSLGTKQAVVRVTSA
jgi:tetratricopeptide (TPR) repeat protein